MFSFKHQNGMFHSDTNMPKFKIVTCILCNILHTRSSCGKPSATAFLQPVKVKTTFSVSPGTRGSPSIAAEVNSQIY